MSPVKQDHLGLKGTRFGFTLLELIVVLVILGLLAAVAIPTYARAVDRAKWNAHVVRDQALANRISAGLKLEPSRTYAEVLNEALAETGIGAFSPGLTAQSNGDSPQESGWTAVTYMETPTDDIANPDNSELWVEIATSEVGLALPTADPTQVAWTFDNAFLRTATRHDDTRMVICSVNLFTQFATCDRVSIRQNQPTTTTTASTTTTVPTTTTPASTTTTTTTVAPAITTTVPPATTTTSPRRGCDHESEHRGRGNNGRDRGCDDDHDDHDDDDHDDDDHDDDDRDDDDRDDDDD
jgi:prepilin-type N-terminal cleavage/methylation domain-containing protein